MLHIILGDYKGKNYIFDPNTYFDNAYEDEWLTDPLSKEMIRLLTAYNNYFVIIYRDSLYELPYSIEEIYGLQDSRTNHSRLY